MINPGLARPVAVVALALSMLVVPTTGGRVSAQVSPDASAVGNECSGLIDEGDCTGTINPGFDSPEQQEPRDDDVSDKCACR